MRKSTIITFIILSFFVCQINAQNQIQTREEEVPYPQVPRVSAYEVYTKYKAGKAIIFHAGGELYNRRHIVGAFNLDVPDESKDKILPKFPKEGIEIFTYCY
jgi:hypothetical protein